MFLLVLHNDCTMYVNDYLISTYIMMMSILVRFSNPIATGKASEAGNLTMSIYAASSRRRMPAVSHLIEPASLSTPSRQFA